MMRFVTPSKLLVGALLLASGFLLFGGIHWRDLAQRFLREDRSDPTGSADAELLCSGDALGAAQGSPASHSTLRDRASVDDASTKGVGVGESGHSAAIEPLVTGRVLDAFGGALLSAKIQVESDPASYVVGRGGQFRVRCERPDSLRISAPGHESVQIEVPAAARALELGEVRLRGSASATICVQSAAGDVLPGMRVRIASSAYPAAKDRGRERPWLDCGVTDAAGELRVTAVPDRSAIDIVITRGEVSAFAKTGVFLEEGCEVILTEPRRCLVAVANRGLPEGEELELQVRSLDPGGRDGVLVSAMVGSATAFELEPGAYELIATRRSGFTQTESFRLAESGHAAEFRWDRLVELVVDVRFEGALLGSDFVAYSETCETQERAEKRRRRTLESGRPQGTVKRGSGGRAVSFHHVLAGASGSEAWVLLAVQAPGAQTWVDCFACTVGAKREVEVRLLPDDAACEIRGKVAALDPGSSVLIYRRPTSASKTWEWQGESRLSSDRSFVFPGLRSGIHELRALGPWMEIPLATLMLAPGEKVDRDFDFLPGAILVRGAPASAVAEGDLQHPVLLACEDGQPTGSWITGVPAEGGVEFTPLAAGDYMITLAEYARRTGAQPTPDQVIALAPGERVVVEWQAPRPTERFRVPIHLGWTVDRSALRVAVVSGDRLRKWSSLEWSFLDRRHAIDIAARRGESLVCVVGVESNSSHHVGGIAPLHLERRVADDSLTALGITVPAPSRWKLNVAGEQADRVRYLEATHEELGALFGHFYPLGVGGEFDLMAPGAYRVKGTGRGRDGATCQREEKIHLSSGTADSTDFEWN
jgi:hypothetical protein